MIETATSRPTALGLPLIGRVLASSYVDKYERINRLVGKDKGQRKISVTSRPNLPKTGFMCLNIALRSSPSPGIISMPLISPTPQRGCRQLAISGPFHKHSLT